MTVNIGKENRMVPETKCIPELQEHSRRCLYRLRCKAQSFSGWTDAAEMEADLRNVRDDYRLAD
jgi:hypothetical protein